MTLHSKLQHYSLVGKLEVMQVPVKSQTLHARKLHCEAKKIAPMLFLQ